MKPPEFPKEFLRHCPKVLEAKHWHQTLKVDEIDIEQYAECAFHSAGAGMECENCKLFLTRPFLNHELDREFLPQIEEFYRQLAVYDAWCEEQRKRHEEALLDSGAGI